MTGTAKQLIDLIIAQRAKGNPAVAQAVRAKLVLKGINPDSYSSTTPDDPTVIDRLESLAKELGVKRVSIKARLLSMNLVFLAGILAVLLANFLTDRLITRDVIFPSFEDQVLAGHKETLKALVDAKAVSLGTKLRTAKTREDQINLVIAETDPVRFFEDRSGYFFTYDLNGVTINLPVNKTQNGQNLMLLTDGHGNRYVEKIVNAAKEGSGFVEYWSSDEQKIFRPKLSYVKRIPGTDFVIGTGVGIDNVKAEREGLQIKIEERQSTYFIYILAITLFILVLTFILSLMISRSITRSIGPIARL